jgi:hypothetical protein
MERKPRIVQNNCLQLITGCHKKTKIDNLHQETKILKIKNHMELLCTQFLVKTLSPSHCSHEVVKLDPGPRQMKHTLHSRFFESIRDYANEEGNILEINQKKVIAKIHMSAVASAISELGPNSFLGRQPPPIAEIEGSLPRVFQTLLS